MSSETSPLVRYEILGLFVHILNPDDKYCRYNSKNLPQRIQIQWSKKLKVYFQFFITFLKLASNSEHLEKKDRPQKLCIPKNFSEKYFRYCVFQKACLLKCVKGRILEHPPESTYLRVPNTAEICTKTLFLYCVMVLRHIELENVSLSQIWNLRTRC